MICHTTPDQQSEICFRAAARGKVTLTVRRAGANTTTKSNGSKITILLLTLFVRHTVFPRRNVAPPMSPIGENLLLPLSQNFYYGNTKDRIHQSKQIRFNSSTHYEKITLTRTLCSWPISIARNTRRFMQCRNRPGFHCILQAGRPV